MVGALLSVLFFLSGAASLVYEVLWVRVLGLGIGSTTRALSLVLAIFFLGLSLGSFLAGRWKSRVHPLKLYGLVEGLLGLYGALVLFPLLNFSQLLSWFPMAGSFSWVGNTAKFLLVGILLTPATVAMGATLPLLIRAVPTLGGGRRDGVSHWYAINTFGAVGGVVAASFWLLPSLGVVGANFAAVALNIGVALGAWVLGTRFESQAQGTASVPQNTAQRATGPGALSPRVRLLLGLTALCGFSSLVLEVVWNKYLGIYLGNNVYGLGLVLAVYLFGLALGSWICRYKVLNLPNGPAWLVGGIFAACLLATLATTWLNSLPVVTHSLGYLLFKGSPTGGSLLWLKCILGTLALFPATLLFGALFPITVKLVADSEGDTPRSTSWAYAANTLGAILGSYLAGVVFIPHFGSNASVQIAGFGLLVAGVLGAYVLLPQRRVRWAAAALPLAVLVLVVQFDFKNIVKSAYSQRIVPGENLSQTLRYFTPEYEEFVWVKEGETSLITLGHDPKDGEAYQDYYRLKTNGLNESIYHRKNLSELPRYEALLGLLPYLYAPEAKNAFVVGFGGGFTVDLLTSFPLKKVRVVELEQAIIDAAKFAHGGSNPVLKRRNLDLSIEDARYVLVTKVGGPWDIIVSQPSQSWLAGAANLFTREFFEIVSSNLSEKGLYSQWLNLYNMDTLTLRSILRTFYGVFPHGAVFHGEGDQEMILIGSHKPLEWNHKEAQRLAMFGKNRERLAQVPFRGIPNLQAHFVMNREGALAAAGDAPWNTDRNAFAETRQSRLFYTGVPASESPQAFLVSHYQPEGVPDLVPGTDSHYQTLSSLSEAGQYRKFYKLLAHYEKSAPDTPVTQGKLGYLYLRGQRYESARQVLEKALKGAPDSTHFNLLLSAEIELDRPDEVIRLIQKHPKLRDEVTDCYWVAAETARGRAARVKRLVDKMVGEVGAYTAACGDYFNKVIADYYFENEKYDTAIAFFEAYRMAFPSDPVVNRRLSVSYMRSERWAEGETMASQARSAAEHQTVNRNSTASYFDEQGLHADAEALRRSTNKNAE